MSYQVRTRRCRKCQKRSTHWRELPDLPSNWAHVLDDLPLILWEWLTVGWNCRACSGVPKGPLGASILQGRSRQG